MPNYSEHYKFALPTPPEFYDINQTNETTAAIDAALADFSDKLKNLQINPDQVINILDRAIQEGKEVEATKLGGYNAEDFVLASSMPNYATKSEIPTKVSQLENDKEYATRGELKNAFPEGGIVGQVLKKTSGGTEWASDNDTTYSLASSTRAGLLSPVDKAAIDAIPTTYVTNDRLDTFFRSLATALSSI